MACRLKRGKKLGPFVLGRQVGVGGTAEVWSAFRDGSQGKDTVALKFLLHEPENDYSLYTCFIDELRVAKQLDHENIVRVHELYHLGGYFVQSMEFVDGASLADILSTVVKQGCQIPLDWGLLVASDIARGLSYAHALKGNDGEDLCVVHRDVSPHNVMVSRSGIAKLGDFGIAVFEDRLDSTLTGRVKGKFGYMAPEQILGETAGLGVDIFCAGIVLWELLATKKLFAMPDCENLLEVINTGKTPDVRTFNAAVPEDIADMIARMLSASPGDRPRSMRLVVQLLDRAVRRQFSDLLRARQDFAAWLAHSGLKKTEHTRSNSLDKTVRQDFGSEHTTKVAAQISNKDR